MKRLVVSVVLVLVISSGLYLVASESQDQIGLGVPDQEVLAKLKQPKLGPGLSQLLEIWRESGSEEAARFALERNLSLSNGLIRLLVTISPGTAKEVSNLIVQIGGKVEDSVGDLLEVVVPLERLLDLTASKAVRWVAPPTPPIALATVSEGVRVIGAPSWQAGGLTGQGVKVGVLDVGFRGYTNLLGEELPGQVTVRSFRSDGDISAFDHGTAVAEIVHDLAPRANLYFTNYDNERGYAQAINWLIQQGVQVVNSSTGFYCRGSQDGTGTINSAVREATSRGILWVNSAGNAAKHHWSGAFTDSDNDRWHNFDGVIEVNEIELSAGDIIYACLSWDDWPASSLDYDFYLYDSFGNVVASSVVDQSSASPSQPFEEFRYTVSSSAKYRLAIWNYNANRAPRMHLFVHFLQGGVGCVATTALENQPRLESRLGLLRRFRDEVLDSSAFGRALEASYYRHSLEMAKILLFDSSLRSQAVSIITGMEPFVEAMVSQETAKQTGPVINTQLVSRIQEFANRLTLQASRSLREDIKLTLEQLSLDQAVGLTGASFWERVKNAEPIGHLETPLKPLRYRNPETSLTNPADSVDVMAVGAVYWADDSLEDYSSQGPTLDNRIKPDVMGPTRVCTVTRGSCGAGGFAGTSASAPHIAGAAALVKQLKPGANRFDLETFIRTRTVDLLQLGPDNQSGWGRLNLGSAFVATSPIASIDSPSSGATVSSSVRVSGWAIHPEVGAGTGVDSIHLYLDAPAGQSQPIGAARYGLDRPDVANAFGSQRFRLSGWYFDWNTAGLSPGQHTLYVYIHSSATDWSVFTRQFNKAAVGPALLAIDWPKSNAVVSGVVRVAGWAIHPDASSGTGVNAVHLYLDGPAGQGQGIAPAIYGLDRPDVANAFGQQRFRFSGWYFNWNTAGLSPGSHTLYVYTYSTLSGWSYQIWLIRK